MNNQEKQDSNIRYVSQVVGRTFEEWKTGWQYNRDSHLIDGCDPGGAFHPDERWLGDWVTISAPTGSGKTQFILRHLVEYAYSNGVKILYLVNRKVLKKQLDNEIREMNKNLIYNIDDVISVNTYQCIEQQLKESRRKNKGVENWGFMGYDYSHIIFDEVHYFYSDALFNTSTYQSYEFLIYNFRESIKIFLSATMENIIDRIHEDRNHIIEKCAEYNVNLLPNPDIEIPKNAVERNARTPQLISYKVLGNMDNVQVRIVSDDDKLVEIAACSDSKWLIFVESKKHGNELLQSFKKAFGADEESDDLESEVIDENNDVVFLDAKYEKLERANETVTDIVQKKWLNKKIVITTSVLDTGISIHDSELRHIVIMADNRETFLQMLGRKRRGDEKLLLCIYKRNATYFKSKLSQMQELNLFYKECESNITKLEEERRLSQLALNLEWGYNDVQNRNVRLVREFQKILEKTKNNDTKGLSGFCEKYMNTLCEVDNDRYNDDMIHYIDQRRKHSVINRSYLLENILGNERKYMCARKLLTEINGEFVVNSFSVQKMMNNIFNYNRIIENFERDEDAFIREQMKWLGKADIEIDRIIESHYKEVERQFAEKVLEYAAKGEITESEMIDFKLDDKDMIWSLMEKFCIKLSKSSIGKKDRPISQDNMNLLLEQCGIPYEYVSKKKICQFIKK
ncbi:MAG: DEAD/DEAH box helicase family protein [Eubacteriales bacterium]